MQNIESEELLKVVQSSSKICQTFIDNVTTDSRLVRSNSLFIAIKGENADGHYFVKSALEKGAELAIVDHLVDDVAPQRQVLVQDTLMAYGRIGQFNRMRFKGIVVGVTGSAGKTTTKEEIKFALSQFGKVYATTGNHNNFIGVPQSLCEMDMEADFAVIEMGMSAQGEIARLTSFVKPDVALITNVYPMHIEFFENFEGIARAKAEIFEGLVQGGIAIINEDTNFADILEEQALKQNAKLLKFGKRQHYSGHLVLEQETEVNLYNAWAALKVVEALGLETKKAADALKDFGALEGRGKIHHLCLKNGICFTLIDDSYSGQPEAMKFAIDHLSAMKTSGRKIALLGKMAELGETSQQRHIEVGQKLSESDVDIVIGVCPETKDMLSELRDNQEQYYFENKDGVYAFLTNKLLQNNDILLIKGARYSSKLYQVTDALLKGAK